MLIELSITNFLSIRERQTLSMTSAYRADDLPDNVIFPKLPSMSGLSFLKGAAVYGANASGKSNILAAAAFLVNYVKKSATEMKPTGGTGVVPFLLSKKTVDASSEFEVVFSHKNIRYDYRFALDKSRIIAESLFAFPKGRPKKIFVRTFDRKKGKYTFDFGSIESPYSGLKEKTRPNALFLSVGVQFNAEELLAPYEWFDDYLKIINLSEDVLSPDYTAQKAMQEPESHGQFRKLLCEADLGITDFEIRKVERVNVHLPEDIPEAVKQQIIADLKSKNVLDNKNLLDIRLEHKCTDGSPPVKFGLGQESSGTRRLFSLLGPWHDVLKRGVTIFIDELEASLHPLLARKLVKLICGPQNKSGAQLIFTTHNTNLLDASLLRRDQIWFTEKENDGGTRLYPLSDYHPRKEESLQKGYLAGRYGAIPMLGEDLSFYE